MLLSECAKFIRFKDEVDALDYINHLDYLNSFVKLLFKNVKRPCSLYEECLIMIDTAHIFKMAKHVPV